jgi:hypothetical protein
MKGRALAATIVAVPLLVACAAAVPTTPQPTASIEPGRADVVVPVALRAPRASHTATKLADGSVLVVGGFGLNERSERSMELFAPSRGVFEAAGTLDIPRYSHTATLLADGRVLIVGGYGDGAVRTASATVYDPLRRALQPTGSLAAPRADHTAVRLVDGRVLVVGGTGEGTSFLASAEIYDPATGTFTGTGPMREPRDASTLTVLRDGRVLVAGGHHGRSPNTVVLASAEIFDPRTGLFTPTGRLSVPRHKHDAVLLEDGSVMVIAGSDARDDRGLYTTLERFDPATNAFVAAGSLVAGRHKIRGMTAVLPDGWILVAGGAPRAELIRPGLAPVAFTASFGRAPMAGTATLLDDGRVLLAGGYSLTGPASRDAWLLSAR